MKSYVFRNKVEGHKHISNIYGNIINNNVNLQRNTVHKEPAVNSMPLGNQERLR